MADVFQQLVYFTDLVVAKIVGLESMEAESDVMEYADVVVATPGRIAAHIQQKPNLLSYLKLIVLDEADKLLAPVSFYCLFYLFIFYFNYLVLILLYNVSNYTQCIQL